MKGRPKLIHACEWTLCKVENSQSACEICCNQSETLLTQIWAALRHQHQAVPGVQIVGKGAKNRATARTTAS